MEPLIVLSHFQAALLLQLRDRGQLLVSISPDLSLTTCQVSLSSGGVLFPGGVSIDWAAIEAIASATHKCFLIEDGQTHEIKNFSQATNRFYSLYPTIGAPTLLVSGIPMHRIKGTDPHQDTLQKIKAIKPVIGRVLDTATGLGYTAIEAARSATKVITIELDPVVLQIARQNPWSQELFQNPRIEQIIGDSFEEVKKLSTASISRIIHDPPVLSLAGQLYSGAFYQELYRVLEDRGRLFHYIGDPDSKSGHHTTGGVVRRLKEAGFSQIVPRPKAFGVMALKR